jgi:phage gp36-like protein
MAYITLTELIERFGEPTMQQLADRDGDDVIDADVADRAIADADAVIDGYLGARYELPLASTPPMLTPIAADIVFYKLHPHGAPEEARLNYDRSIRMLEGLSKGTIRLDVEGAEPDAPGQRPETEGPERTFSRDSMKGF